MVIDKRKLLLCKSTFFFGKNRLATYWSTYIYRPLSHSHINFSQLLRCINGFLIILDDIYDEASGSISALGLDTECLGGGRIEHFPDKKFLKVYGYSQVCIDYC